MPDVSLPAPAVTAPPEIELRGLSKRFGKAHALDGLDLRVAPGSRTALLGLAGAGKSTVLRVLAGLARLDGGTATVGGDSVALGAGLATRARIGLCEAEPRFPAWMTGREVLAYAADLLGVPRDDVDALVTEALDRVGLEPDDAGA